MDPLQKLIDSFHADGRPRVWSLIVTVMGDAVMHRGGEIETAQLLTLAARLGIAEPAVRTALSRLLKDGWLTSRKDGRKSWYGLAPSARRETAAASERIYAPAPGAEPWVFGVSDPPAGALQIPTGGWIAPAESHEDALIAGTLCASWDTFATAVLSQDHRQALDRLNEDLANLPPNLSDALDAMAARTLLMHRWRRFVLRFPDLPHLPDMPGGHPRDRMKGTYRALHLSEDWLGADAAPLLERF